MINQLAPLTQKCVTVRPDNPRALSADVLAAILLERGLIATSCGSVESGVHLAIERAGTDGIVCALGSLYLLGEVRALLGAK